MHELTVTLNIVEIVGKNAGNRRVKRVTIEIGQLSAVAPDAIRYCFDLCAEGTVVEGAKLEIHEIPGSGVCNECGNTLEITLTNKCCPCGSNSVRYTGGFELLVKEMEVE